MEATAAAALAVSLPVPGVCVCRCQWGWGGGGCGAGVGVLLVDAVARACQLAFQLCPDARLTFSVTLKRFSFCNCCD